MKTCCCTNQCPACGTCCQVDCGHRRSAGGGWVTTPNTGPFPQTYPVTPATPPSDLDIRIVPRTPLTEEGLRKILKEAFAEALAELRQIKGEPANCSNCDGAGCDHCGGKGTVIRV